MDKQRRTVKDYLDSLVDDQGIKSEVTVTLTNGTLWKAAGTLVGSGLAITILVFVVKGIAKNIEQQSTPLTNP